MTLLQEEKYNINSFQNLAGVTIHDDAASHNVRYNRKDFIDLKTIEGELNGVTGTTLRPSVGSVVDNNDIWKDVVHVPELGYNIDSERQLVDLCGWSKDHEIKNDLIKRYYKSIGNGKIIDRVYVREKNNTHFIKVNSLLMEDDDKDEYLRMLEIHEKLGHMTPSKMLLLTQNYSERNLGFSKKEVKEFKKVFKCTGCRSAKGKLRRKPLITSNYKDQMNANSDGLDIDILYCNSFTFLLAKSRRYKYT